MQEQGTEEEEAALSLGASGLQTFFRVTLPNVKWALLYGVLLCNARAMGEFGAVSVVSGHIRGETNTMPLHVEILYNEYQFVAAFAVASLLALLALVTLVAKVAARAARIAQRTRTAHGESDIRSRRPSSVRRLHGARRTSISTVAVGRAGRAARAVGLGQDHAAAHHRRARVAGRQARCTSTARMRWRAACGERHVGFVFQHYALFRHLTVFENVAFGLRVQPRRDRPPKREIAHSVRRAARARAARLARATAIRTSSPAASASASRSPARSRSSRACCCSTSRSARSTPRCARNCAAGCASCTTRSTSPRLRHPRSGGGAGSRRPRRRDQPGPHRADRAAGRCLRAAPPPPSSMTSSASPSPCR